MLLKVNKESQSGNYMFTNNGGAIGTIRTGIKLPPYFTLTNVVLQGAFLADGGSGAKISVGLITLDQNPVSVLSASIQTAVVVTGMNSTKIADVVNAALPMGSDLPFEVIVQISVGAVTAGSLAIFCEYYSRDKTLF